MRKDIGHKADFSLLDVLLDGVQRFFRADLRYGRFKLQRRVDRINRNPRAEPISDLHFSVGPSRNLHHHVVNSFSTGLVLERET